MVEWLARRLNPSAEDRKVIDSRRFPGCCMSLSCVVKKILVAILYMVIFFVFWPFVILLGAQDLCKKKSYIIFISLNYFDKLSAFVHSCIHDWKTS